MMRSLLFSTFGVALVGFVALSASPHVSSPGGARPDTTEYVRPDIPRTWDSTALADFMLHLPDPSIEVRPISEAYYYSLPVRTVWKTYPAYHPDYEPAGYLDSLQQLEPEVVFDASELKTRADWIAAGERVFEAPHIFLPMALGSGPQGPAARDIPTTSDGVFPRIKYVVREPGRVELGVGACADCHSRIMPDGSLIEGAQGNHNVDLVRATSVRRAAPSPRVDSLVRLQDWELYGAPWVDHPSQRELDTLTQKGFIAAHSAVPEGVMARQGTSLRYPVRIPDLRGVSEHRFLDATGHMRNRGLGDIMRYAAFNENVDLLNRYGDWIPVLGHHEGPLPPPSDSLRSIFNGPFDRFTDEQLYALALYLYSLEPVPSPHTYDEETLARGRRVFVEEGCVTCHTPPLYTNNMLTPVDGFTPPEEHFEKYDIFDLSIETDPGLALYTRRSTGYYKVPSLRGLWYRSPLLHDGSITTLEELLDPRRLEADYVPSGFKGVGVERRAVPGHPFGLELSDEDKAALIAFMKTL